MTTHHKPIMAASKKVDYERIEPTWRACILSPRQAKADELVTKNAVTKPVTTEAKVSERDIVEANAAAVEAMATPQRGERLEKRSQSSRFVASKGVGGPPAPRQADGMLSTRRAQQARREAAAKALLKVQNAMLALIFAGWTKIWLPADSLSVWLRCKHENARGDLAKLVVGKLRSVLFALTKLRFQVTYFLLKRRYLLQLRIQRLIERDHGNEGVSDLLEKIGANLLGLGRVALSDKASDKILYCGQRGERCGGFSEHGCPSDGMVQVEEQAFSVGVGDPPVGALKRAA